MDAASLPLDRFFAPASVAVIGASPERHRIRGLLLHMLRANGYAGRILPVNPSYAEIDGLRCFPSVGAIGEPVDLALVAIPAPAVLTALEDCAAAGVRHAVVITSGFAEQGGAEGEMQQALAALAKRTGMRISGPNGEGFHNEIARVSATFSPAVDIPPGAERLGAGGRRIGVVAQSGGIGFALYNRGRALGLEFSYVVSTGNEADLAAGDFFDHMARDPATDAVILFLEGVRDPTTFTAAAARAADAGKPVIVVKIGRTAAGERAAASHTASMTGWNAAYEAVFRRYGMIAAEDPDEAVAAAAALTTLPPARGERVAVVTTSGGAGAWAADALAAAGLVLPEPSPALQGALRGVMPPYGSARNPIDVTAQAIETGGLVRAIELLAASGEADIVVAVTSLASDRQLRIDPAALARIVAMHGTPVVLHSYTLPSALSRKGLAAAGIIVHSGLAETVAATRALVERARYVPGRAVAPLLPSAPSLAGIEATLRGTGSVLAEHEAKSLLAEFGIVMPLRRLVADAAALEPAAAALGFPLAVKIQSPDILHKTEAGGVRLGLADLAAVRAARDAVLAEARRRRPAARIDGILLERMAAPGVEMIVGALRDPVLGPLVMVGTGGVTAELFKDVAYRPAPVDEAEARAMVEELRGAPLLTGFRGAPPTDIGALAALVARLSAFAARFAEMIAEVELNPVMVHAEGAGCTIVDALLIKRREPAP